MATFARELSVFVDESGSFDHEYSPSRFYVVSFVLHDQGIPIASNVSALELAPQKLFSLFFKTPLRGIPISCRIRTVLFGRIRFFVGSARFYMCHARHDAEGCVRRRGRSLLEADCQDEHRRVLVQVEAKTQQVAFGRQKEERK